MNFYKMKAGLAIACIIASISHANAETANGSIGFTGNSSGLCTLDNTPIDVGTVNLATFENMYGTATLIPISLAVSCNTPTLPWKIYGTNDGNPGLPITIGSTANQGCLMSASPLTEQAGIVCAVAGSTGDDMITGTGTSSVDARIAIWFPSGGSQYPFGGTGAISGTIPVILEF